MRRPAQPLAARLVRAAVALSALLALGVTGCVPDRGPPSPRGVHSEPPVPRPRPTPPAEAPEPDLPPGPWPEAPPPIGEPGTPHPLDPAPLPAPWPIEVPIAGVQFERTVVADEAVVGLAATERGIFVGTASGGIFRAEAPAGFRPSTTGLPPLRGFFGGGAALVACPADGAPARVDLGHGWARLDVGCAPGGRRTVAFDKQHGYLLDGDTLRDGAWPGLPRRRPAPVVEPRVIAADAGLVVVVGRRSVAASEDAGATFTAGERADPPAVLTPRDVALTGKGRAVLVGAGDGRAAIEYSRDGGRTWRAAEQAPARLADDLASVTVDARGVFYAVPRTPGVALRSDDGGRTWRALDLRIAVGPGLLPASEGALAGAARGLVAGLDRDAPLGPGLDRPLWRAVFTHPRIGIGVGVLGGIWRTLDGGHHWFAVPGTAGLPFTDLDRLGGHAVVAVGQGLFRRSDDAGARWDARPPPGSCEARWVRFAGDRGLADCADGQPAVSDDGGLGWVRGAAAPTRRAVVWLDDAVAFTLALDGRLGICPADGTACAWSDPPAAFVELARAVDGISAIDASGRLWWSAGPEAPWLPGAESGVEAPVAHLPLADGRALVLDRAALYAVSPAGGARLLGPVPGARALVAPGDGAVIVLQDGAVTRFDPR